MDVKVFYNLPEILSQTLCTKLTPQVISFAETRTGLANRRARLPRICALETGDTETFLFSLRAFTEVAQEMFLQMRGHIRYIKSQFQRRDSLTALFVLFKKPAFLFKVIWQVQSPFWGLKKTEKRKKWTSYVSGKVLYYLYIMITIFVSIFKYLPPLKAQKLAVCFFILLIYK